MVPTSRSGKQGFRSVCKLAVSMDNARWIIRSLKIRLHNLSFAASRLKARKYQLVYKRSAWAPAPATSSVESAATSLAPTSSEPISLEPISSEPLPETSSASSSSSSSASSSSSSSSADLPHKSPTELQLPPSYNASLPEPARDNTFLEDVKRVRKNLNGSDLNRKLALLGEVWARELKANSATPAAEFPGLISSSNGASAAMSDAKFREGINHNGHSFHLANVVPEIFEN